MKSKFPKLVVACELMIEGARSEAEARRKALATVARGYKKLLTLAGKPARPSNQICDFDIRVPAGFVTPPPPVKTNVQEVYASNRKRIWSVEIPEGPRKHMLFEALLVIDAPFTECHMEMEA